MKLKEDFQLRQIGGQSFIIAEGLQSIDFSKLIKLNETAAFLWREAKRQGEFTVDTLVAALLQEYDVDKTLALKDCQRIADAWQQEGMLE